MSRERGFMFTLNNYTDESIEMLGRLGAQYLIYGKEIAPTTNTPHLQGYIHFQHAKSLSSVIKKIPGAHVEIRRGTVDQAIEYCKKEGAYTEVGAKPKNQKEKGELGAAAYEEAWQLAKAGKIEEIQAGLRTRYFRTYISIGHHYRAACLSNQVLSNQWYWGETGTGKSRSARALYPLAYVKNLNKWWDGYDGQDTVIIDEWSPDHGMLASYLKIWSDHYPFRAEVKGSSMMIRPTRIIITSNYSITECFKTMSDILPISRRFEEIHFPVGGHRGGYMEGGKLHTSP